MAATLPLSGAASPLLLHCNAAPSVSFRHRRRWQRPTATRHDGRGAQQLPLLVARFLPAAVPPGANGACGAIAASGPGAAAWKAPYRGSEGQGSLWMVFLATAVVVCGSFEFGTCVGYSAPAQAGIVSDIGLSNSEYGVFGSVLTIGAMLGAVTSGRLADILGRKMTMRFAAVVGIFGWLTVYFAKDAMVLYAGRVLLGYCTGVLSYVVPVFISEIAPKGIRGGLATSNQLFICSGCSAAYIIGALVSWRSLVLVGLVPCAVLLVGLFFIPESPRWLVGVGLMIFQQLGGINALGFYTSYIFSSAGFSGKLGTTLIGIIQIPITFFGALLMDRSGRRALLLVSSSGTFLGCFLTGLSFYVKAQGLCTQLVPTLALCGILVYYAAYSVGMGPVPWVIMSEIFSIDMKAIAGGFVTLASWIGSFAISYSFNFLMDWNPAGTFFLFSAASLVTVLFVAKVVPETKGRTLEEIQRLLKAT
ncbi:sugar transporter ERD6-like 16 isoform X2 [Miscanthus floridulus]|uniref:sugar transporter ERD6-like 16 isoform X2 n=1 Tax=Miscanthus floridulus TaxID=154761 RepID=UPI003457F611